MIKNAVIFLMLIPLILSCQGGKDKQESEVIEINITEALNNQRDFPLSKIVKDVEILELESNENCYMQYPLLSFYGKNYILIFDIDQTQLFLFENSGEFIRKIGANGEGPGEYNGMQLKSTMCKDEKYIIISDSGGRKVIVYDIEGEMLAQKDISDHFETKYILDMNCHLDNLISFVPHRPWQPAEGFASVVLFDFELNKVGEVLPREPYPASNIQHAGTIIDDNGAYFWEMYSDTVFQYFPDGTSQARYRFVTDKNELTEEVMYSREWSRDIYNYTFPVEVYFIPGYLVSYILNDSQTIFYDLKTQESFSTGEKVSCFIESDRSKIFNCLKNDMFGFEPVRIRQYFPDQKVCVTDFDWGRLSTSRDLDCIKNLKVSHPHIRDQLLEYCENPSEDLGMVLLVMEMR